MKLFDQYPEKSQIATFETMTDALQQTGTVKYELHPFATIFPDMAPGAWKGFVDSIRKNGLRKPITLYRGPDDSEYRILDGRLRAEACNLLSINPEYEVLPQDVDPLEYVLDANACHRNLSESIRAMVASKVADM